MPVTNDSGLLPIFKTFYTDEKMEQLLWQASPLLRMIKKNHVFGKSYNFAATYGAGGACAGDATIAAAAAAADSGKNAEFSCTGGQLFSIFNVGTNEILASENVRGAYVPVPVNKMFTSTASFRRVFAIALYGQGFGEVGQVGATAAGTITQGAANTVDFEQHSIVAKLDLGVTFIVTNGATPVSTLRSLECKVTNIDGTKVTFTASAGTNETWAATDWIEIKGCRSGTTPLLPIGLGAWLPTIADRTGATWTTYIGTDFYGVDRSVFPDRLAGNYVKRDVSGSEKYIDCITRAIKAVRVAGGEAKWIVVNPDDYIKIASEINGQTTYWQSTETSAKGKKNEVARGISDVKFMFASSYADMILPDPYCPRYTSYVLDEQTIEFVMTSNGNTPVQDGIAGNNPGSQPIDGVTVPDLKSSYSFIWDDYVTIQPASLASNGPVLQVILQLFGTFALRAPGHNAVINFVS